MRVKSEPKQWWEKDNEGLGLGRRSGCALLHPGAEISPSPAVWLLKETDSQMLAGELHRSKL